MKVKISISIDKKTISQVESKVNEGTYRNKSHFIEQATKRMLTEGTQHG